MIELARELARHAHAGQVDKSGNDFFLSHVEPIAEKMQADGYEDKYIAVALLHDVLEDTAVPNSVILELFGPEISMAVLAITRGFFDTDITRESYEQYLVRVKANKIAKRVKFYDIQNNLAPRRMNKLPEHTRTRLKAKYFPALSFLTGN